MVAQIPVIRVNSNCASLSNYEVFKHLQKIKDGKKKHKGQLATITYETLRYLETTHINDQSADSIKNCMKDLSAFNLSKTELLMIINSPPSTAIDIQLVNELCKIVKCFLASLLNKNMWLFLGMVEESEERLTEEQVQDILEIVAKHFPYVVKEKVEEDNEEELE